MLGTSPGEDMKVRTEHSPGGYCCLVTDSFVTPWTMYMGFSRQEYRSGLPFPSPGDLHNPEIKFLSPALQVDSLPLSHWEAVLVKRQRQLGLIRFLKWYNAVQEIRC